MTVNATNRIIDINKMTAERIKTLSQLKKLDRGVRYRDSVMSGELTRGTHEEKVKNLKAWAKKNNLPNQKPAICPKCNLPMNPVLAEKQIKNNREGGVECMACIMGYKRKSV